MTHSAILAFGGNLSSEYGTPIETQAEAVKRLMEGGVRFKAVSGLYQTAPVPPSGQPDFINCAALVETDLSPEDLLALCHRVEVALGRQRDERWSARTLDIDLLACGDFVLPSLREWQDIVEHPDPAHFIDQPMVPHPRLHLRGFVLAPLMEVVPDWCHPVLGKTVAQLYAELDATGGLVGVTRISTPLPGLPALQHGRGHV